mmetsp:Transcript_12488/g.18331  ORF Transcript_12488/g.18331 Transcript_12488/m.18331 type:complete len:503 (-) Transcript_12488:1365-2873(-)
MNSLSECHEIEGCPGLFIDAFRGSMLKKTSDSNNIFILSHYHGDHYQSLPKSFKYQGPALIHCTPVTAALLRDIHEVPSSFVVQHNYAETWEVGNKTKITFYDANHCPGAAIIVVELLNGDVHLHCGDMRYTPLMKEYPLLRSACRRQKVDVVYLDSTYGHPKHNFCSQVEAVDQISAAVENEFKTSNSTLILLSCYSIGKEKVLRECSRRACQKILVPDRKYRMLKCCGEDMKIYTLDSAKTDIHVIPMGLAGEIWPYFRPNYGSCRDYAEKLKRKHYTKVIAFIPTGWANSSKWNQKNSIVSNSVPYQGGKRIEIEIRLVSYSEHSPFTELLDFVSFLKPRKVIPTVFSDKNDRNKILNHFRNLVDHTRAKQQFFVPMKRDAPRPVSAKSLSNPTKKGKLDIAPKRSIEEIECDELQDTTKLKNLIDMGFLETAAKEALKVHHGHVEAAIEHLLNGASLKQSNKSVPEDGSLEHSIQVNVTTNQTTKESIANFFPPRHAK